MTQRPDAVHPPAALSETPSADPDVAASAPGDPAPEAPPEGRGKRPGRASRLQLKLWLGVGLALAAGFAILQFYQLQSARAAALNDLLREARALRGLLDASGEVAHEILRDSNLPMGSDTVALLPIHALARIAKQVASNASASVRIEVVTAEPDGTAARPGPDAEAIAFFKQHPDAEEHLERTLSPDGNPVYLYAQPIWTESYCLVCHGDPDRIPTPIRQRFPTETGYRVGELRGVLAIRLPVDEVEHRTFEHFRQALWIQLMVFVTLFLVGGALLQHFVISKLGRIQWHCCAMPTGPCIKRSKRDGTACVSSRAYRPRLQSRILPPLEAQPPRAAAGRVPGSRTNQGATSRPDS